MQAPATPGLLRLYRDLWRYAGGNRKSIVLGFALLLASQLFKLGVPYLSGRALNTLQQHGLDGFCAQPRFLLLLIFSATLLSWMLHGPGRVLERNVALVVRRELSGALIARALSLPLPWHAQYHSGETAHRVRQCSGALYDFAQSQFIYLQNAVRLVGPVIALWLIAPLVGALAVGGYAVIAWVIVRFDRRMVALAHAENAAERRYVAAVLDGLGNVFSVYALRMAQEYQTINRAPPAAQFTSRCANRSCSTNGNGAASIFSAWRSAAGWWRCMFISARTAHRVPLLTRRLTPQRQR